MQAQNDNPANGCSYDIDVAPQSLAQTRVPARIAGNRRLCCTYEGLLRSAIAAFRIEQDRLAPTTLATKASARADYRDFAADWKTPDIQTENFAVPLRAATFEKAAAQLTLRPGGTRVPTGSFLKAIR